MTKMNWDKARVQDKVGRYKPLGTSSAKKPYLPTQKEVEFLDWLAMGCEKHSRKYLDWKKVLHSVRGKDLYLCRIAFKTAVEKKSLPDENVVAYAMGVYKNISQKSA